MKMSWAITTWVALGIPSVVLADPPKTLRVAQSIVIKAPVEAVWSASKDFDGLAKWHPALEKDEIVKGTNNVPGAVRTLSLKGGGTIQEQLLAFSEPMHSFKYKILESPLPVAGYVSTFTVKAGTDNTVTINWVGTFKRKNSADNPPDDQTDDAAKKVIAGIYSSGLANLKKQVEH
jgi:Polyketide cyclase / dehydrase and lipid transport